MSTSSIKLTRGQIVHLDDIYDYQNIGGRFWWEPISDDGGDKVVITMDIEISFTRKQTMYGEEGQINWRISNLAICPLLMEDVSE